MSNEARMIHELRHISQEMDYTKNTKTNKPACSKNKNCLCSKEKRCCDKATD